MATALTLSTKEANIITYRTIARLGSFSQTNDGSNEKSTATTVSTAVSPVEAQMMEDIKQVRRSLDLFLNSRVVESEEILEPHLCKKSMYYALGRGVLLCLRAVMTFERDAIQLAVDALQNTVTVSNTFRGKNGWLDSITSLVKNRLTVSSLKTMSRVERHAELVYAESYLLKALLCIIRDENLYSFLREGLHIKNSYGKYVAFMKFILEVRQEAEMGKDISGYGLDDHFTSGVLFGLGCFNIMLSLLPQSVLRFFEFIGFSGDREYGMGLIEAVGGWDLFRETGVMPEMQGPEEGLRRQFCDLLLMAYHILLTKIVTVNDVDEEFASHVLDYSLRLYPDGIFFIFFNGRQLLSKTQLDQSKAEYLRAANIQKEWKQLQHMCFWELGMICLLQQDWENGIEYYDVLCQESNWSKAVYGYLKGICMFMAAQRKTDPQERKKLRLEAGALMTKVPHARQKIVGKSIPIEKFIARKARKFVDQGNRLLFPDLEVLHLFGACEFLPTDLLVSNIARIDEQIKMLNPSHESYVDDYCLAHYLRALLSRFAYIRGERRAAMRAIHDESIAAVFENAQQIKLDHYIYYFTVYENARMLVLDEKYDEAEAQIQIIITANEKQKYNVGAGPLAKSKYSLENVLLFKCHSCLLGIKEIRG